MNDLKRYVLIDSNMIIDTHTDKWLLHCKEQAKTDEDYNVPFSELIKVHLGEIKAQSDNVYDLIEVGDLIKDDDRIYEVSDITYRGYSDNRRSFVSQPAGFKHHEWDITAIYKPDHKGGYIKAWECEVLEE